MKLPLRVAACLLLSAAVPAFAETYVVPGAPTDPGGGTLSPSSVVRYADGGFATVLDLPGGPPIDGLHKLDVEGGWLFSLATPSDLLGALGGGFALPRDVVRYDAGSGYALFFCGGALAPDPIPLSTNVDALALEGGDDGELVLSFDVPTTLGPSSYMPTALVRFARTGPGCGDWTRIGLAFDPAQAAGVAVGTNLVGVAPSGERWLLVFDVPADLSPSAGPETYLPQQVVAWDGASFDLELDLQDAAWPESSALGAFATSGNPGLVAATLAIGKSATTAGDLVLSWDASCSAGAVDYGIYEGALPDFASHVEIDCEDDLADRSEEITPAPGDRYYLVVPRSDAVEGSYGTDSDGVERPAAASENDRCAAAQSITPCP